MKYIKLFENLITDLIKKEEEIKTEKNKVLKLIDDYVKFQPEMWEEWYIDDYNYSFNFNLINWDGRKYLSVEFRYENEERESDFNINLADFLEFAKEPELYKNAKKYNV